MAECGVIYVASGADYVDLACASARSLRAQEPDLPIDIFTGDPVPPGLFDAVHPLTRPGPRAKLTAMQQTRFARTLFLDADTLVVGAVRDLFGLLERFDCAAAHDMRRASSLIREGTVATPAAFPQLNSGVLLYRRSAAMLALLAEWERRFHASGARRDQPILKDLLWASDIRFYVLPPEYNLRRLTLLEAWEPLDARPAIIHSHRLMDHMDAGYRPRGPRLSEPAALVRAERAALAEEWQGIDTDDPVARFRIAQERQEGQGG
ncbi:MAG: hypothetical protein IT542_09610 [Rubellimicrobium sp.]|nr:hypothetical protein [Rubellimicrobium sp.]